jgi:hypothetical protein
MYKLTGVPKACRAGTWTVEAVSGVAAAPTLVGISG